LQAKTVFSLNGIQRLVEVGLIVCSGLAAFMLLALLSFDPSDPSWSQTGYQTDIANFAGPVGAQVADMLFTVFGWLSYLFPPFFAFCGYLLFKRFKDLITIDYLILGLRLLGLLLTVISACAISSINFDDFFMYSSGGVVGDVLSSLLLPNLNFVGSSLLLLCSFCIGMTLLTGISWLTVADELGALVMQAVNFIVNFPARLSAAKSATKPASPSVTTATVTPASSFAAELTEAQQEFASQGQSERQEPGFSALDDAVVADGFNVTGNLDSATGMTGTDEYHWSDYRPVADDTYTEHETAKVSVNDTAGSDGSVAADKKPLDATEAFRQQLLRDKPQSYQPSPEPVALPKTSAIKTETQLQSRAFFPPADAAVEPLPFQPLDIRTESQAFVSVDTLADDELSFSAIDDSFDDDDLNQSFIHTQADINRLLTDEDDEPPFDMDEPVRAHVPQPARPAALNSFGQPLLLATAADAEPLDELPALSLLDRPNKTVNPISVEDLERVSRLVELKLLDFNVDAKVVGVYPGPVVTRFELDLAPGVKVSKITGLSKDLARSLSAISVRVVEVIPGKSFIGLELPNQHREIVRLSEVIGDEVFTESKSPLTMVLGKDIAGKSVVADLAKMPHLLVAGTTGSGKSVGVNVMICSLLYKSTPDDVRFLMIDPKMLELSVYEGIPHLLTEVVTDMKEAANGLRWCVGEMERRYKLMSALGVRNLKGYNVKIADAIAEGHPMRDPLWRPSDNMLTEAPLLEKLPSIVVVIDEFADMMMIVGKKVEELIARIAQKARAAGIHLILATQRPSVDVITGLIKANIPTRIAFQVSSKIDSRTILDQQGAESLLGQGDMLYLPPGSGVPNRVHGAFVDDHEVHAVVADWKKRGRPNYIPEILSGETTEENLLPGETLEDEDAEADPLFDQAVAFVTESRKASVSGVQRRFRIGYNRAARLVETMEQVGIVSGPGHNGNREVLAPPPPKGF
jgi:S-DNA-T family DNA segregation ATPase FtsK/SpoIIIE